MRGTDEGSGSLFSYVDLEARVPKGHPLRTIRAIVNRALSELSADFGDVCAKLCFIGHALMENRKGLFVDTRLTRVSGHAERLPALGMIEPRADRPNPVTLAGDKGFDAADFVMELREINVTPHLAQNTSRRSAIDGRTTRHPGYAVSQRIRKRIEEGFGWMKTIGGFSKTKYRGIEKVGWAFTFAAAAYNLIRLPQLMRQPA